MGRWFWSQKPKDKQKNKNYNDQIHLKSNKMTQEVPPASRAQGHQNVGGVTQERVIMLCSCVGGAVLDDVSNIVHCGDLPTDTAAASAPATWG